MTSPTYGSSVSASDTPSTNLIADKSPSGLPHLMTGLTSSSGGSASESSAPRGSSDRFKDGFPTEERVRFDQPFCHSVGSSRGNAPPPIPFPTTPQPAVDSITAESGDHELGLEAAHMPPFDFSALGGDFPIPAPGSCFRNHGLRQLRDFEQAEQIRARTDALVLSAKASHGHGFREGYVRGVHWGMACGGICGALVMAVVMSIARALPWF